MSDALTADDLKKETVERGPDGELVPERHTIQWGGKEKTIKTKPVTTGVINQLSHIDEEIQRLEPAAVKEAMEVLYVEPDASQFSVGDLQDLPFSRLEALMQPLDEQMSSELGDAEADEGNQPTRA